MWLQPQACLFATVFSSGSQAKQVARADARMKPLLRHRAPDNRGGGLKEGNSDLLRTRVDFCCSKAD